MGDIEKRISVKPQPNHKKSEFEGLLNALIACKIITEEDIRKNYLSDVQKTIDFLLGQYESNKYIGVGVGGVYISNKIKGKKEYVLLYKRYHDPEKGLFSILGGSGVLYKTIQESLVEKTSKLTKVQASNIEIGQLICVNNHKVDGEYHFLSPAFYINNIKNINSQLYWDESKKSENGKEVKIITTKEELEASINHDSSQDDPFLVWVHIDLIRKYANFFSYTTTEAFTEHFENQGAKIELSTYLNNYTIKKLKGL